MQLSEIPEIDIIIWETKEERRPLTKEEYLILESYKRLSSHNELRDDLGKYLAEIGFISESPCQPNGDSIAEYGHGVFATKFSRDPSPEEINAWFFIERLNQYSKHGYEHVKFPMKHKGMVEILKEKDIRIMAVNPTGGCQK